MNKKRPIKHKRTHHIRAKSIGLAPGTLVYTGNKADQDVHISLIKYQGDYFEEFNEVEIDQIPSPDKAEYMIWVNIDGIHNIEVIEKIGSLFNLHPLELEDILHASQQPKLEEYDDNIFMVLRMFVYDQANKEITKNDQLSIVLGSNYLLTFQEENDDLFEPVKERLRKGGPKLRSGKPDYLAYALIDALVDSYFHILEKNGEDIEELEECLFIHPDKDIIQSIHQLRRGLILIRKSVWPLRELLAALQRNENGMIQKSTKIFLRDANDHVIQLIDTIESYREMVVGMQDLYLSSLSNKMNEVMKTLTIIATIFIPLTFLAGIYGMNFKYFPELGMKWMYPWGFWSITILIIALLIWFSKRKKWI